MLRVVILLFLLIGLNGCFIAPGMTMKSPTTSNFSQLKPIFIPITVDLVRKMNQDTLIYRGDAKYYHVGEHDILNIYVWGHRELNGPMGQNVSEQGVNSQLNPTLSAAGYLVSSDGNIFFPLVGTVHVGGKTVEQIRKQLTFSLTKYIRKPQLDIRVIGFRSKKIYVMGEVMKPGLQPITDSPMSITDAINLAGGMDLKSADPGHIFVIRGCYAQPIVYWLNADSPDALLLAENFRLLSQDVLFVSTANVSRWNRAIEQVFPTLQTALFAYAVAVAH